MSPSSPSRADGSAIACNGMCVTCVDGCVGLCEIGRSAYRGAEMTYPQPFGVVSSAAAKTYPVDLSHFTILGRASGAWGIEADSDSAILPRVDLETAIGRDGSIRLRFPFALAAVGATTAARHHWPALAAGAAMTGTACVIGENVAGTDMEAKLEQGRVISSPELEWRVACYRDWQLDESGELFIQANVEDTRLGVQEYALKRLAVKAVELKWGQGAEDGDVKVTDIRKARELQRRGYVVLPDPSDPRVSEAFEQGRLRAFERHSRVATMDADAFLRRVEALRDAGARYISLKTGAYRPADLARAIRFASMAELDLVTVDAGGGGVGAMRPWHMMNEWGVPAVELHSLIRDYCDRLARAGEYVPPIAVAGGFAFEDQIFKGLALGAPYVRLIAWTRAPLAAAMVARTVAGAVETQNLPIEIQRYGTTMEEIFTAVPELRESLGDRFERLPVGAIGVYSYYQRVAQGLRQFMCGARKFALRYIAQDDIAALTAEAGRVSGIPLVSDVDREEAEEILTERETAYRRR